MKHAQIGDLSEVADIIGEMRGMKGIKEKTPLHFYFKGKSILHFHVDNELLFADVSDIRMQIGKIKKVDMKAKKELLKLIKDEIRNKT
jgi:hypothetical protein